MAGTDRFASLSSAHPPLIEPEQWALLDQFLATGPPLSDPIPSFASSTTTTTSPYSTHPSVQASSTYYGLPTPLVDFPLVESPSPPQFHAGSGGYYAPTTSSTSSFTRRSSFSASSASASSASMSVSTYPQQQPQPASSYARRFASPVIPHARSGLVGPGPGSRLSGSSRGSDVPLTDLLTPASVAASLQRPSTTDTDLHMTGGPTMSRYLSQQHQQRKRVLSPDPSVYVAAPAGSVGGPLTKSPRTEAAVPGLPAVLGAKTTIRVFHASVAQKHYGQEKRPLCPPPMVIVDGPCCAPGPGPGPSASLTILDDDGGSTCSQTVSDVRGQVGYFRSLHTASNLDKVHKFEMEIAFSYPTTTSTLPRGLSAPPHGPGGNGPPVPFATLRSECGMISKPSRKTGKARDIKATILNGSLVCCWTRPSLQASRMQYMCFDNGALASRSSSWTAFVISVVRRAESGGRSDDDSFFMNSTPGAEQTVTYGSVVVLTDCLTGARSPPLLVRKVSKTKTRLRASRTASGPVGQMQKCALVLADGEREGYLSASFLVERPSTTPRRPGVPTPSPEIAMPCLPGSRDPLDPSEDEIQEGFAWTMISIAQQTHTFYDASSGSATSRNPITPFPSVIGTPSVDQSTNTLSMVLTGWQPDTTGLPVTAWVGSAGPLPLEIKRSNSIINQALHVRCSLPAPPRSFGFVVPSASSHHHNSFSPTYNPSTYRSPGASRNGTSSDPKPILVSRSDGITYALPFAIAFDPPNSPFSSSPSARVVRV